LIELDKLGFKNLIASLLFQAANQGIDLSTWKNAVRKGGHDDGKFFTRRMDGPKTMSLVPPKGQFNHRQNNALVDLLWDINVRRGRATPKDPQSFYWCMER
jgi:hypothetical protein